MYVYLHTYIEKSVVQSIRVHQTLKKKKLYFLYRITNDNSTFDFVKKFFHIGADGTGESDVKRCYFIYGLKG